jgi:dCTP deaminase
VLTGPEIKNRMRVGQIVIDPPPEIINPNSVNMRLGKLVKTYKKAHRLHEMWDAAWRREEMRREHQRSLGYPPEENGVHVCRRDFGYYQDHDWMPEPLDCKVKEETVDWEIPDGGVVLWPNMLYLMHTHEYTETHGLVPTIEGRSGVARLGIVVHLTAGFGDVGFKGDWTLEVTVVHPIKVYHSMSVCQIAYSPAEGEIQQYTGKYQGQRGPKASGHWKEFQK